MIINNYFTAIVLFNDLDFQLAFFIIPQRKY